MFVKFVYDFCYFKLGTIQWRENKGSEITNAHTLKWRDCYRFYSLQVLQYPSFLL